MTLHLEALKNLQLNYGVFKYMRVAIPWVAELLQMYRKRIQDLLEATDFGNGVATPTTEQLRQGVWLLRERRSVLAKPETDESLSMVKDLACLMEENALFYPLIFDENARLWKDHRTLERMIQHVIPEGVPLTLDALMMEPSNEMTLETLKLH
ncbi:hypothetical protein SeMB42_g02609, partial [Synchytrium endobioticum]